MPNIWVEYTSNLKAEGRIPELLAKMGEYLINYEGEVFPPGGTRLRGVEIDEYFMADGKDDYAFVHLDVSIGQGRPEEQMRAAFDGMFAIVKDHFKVQFEQRLLAIFMEVNEANSAWTWRHNNVHRKFQAMAAAKAAGR